MKNVSLVLGGLAVAAFNLATSALAETVIIKHGHPHCHMVKTVKFGPGGKRVTMRRVCG